MASPAWINTLIYNMRRNIIKSVSPTTFDNVEANVGDIVLELDESVYRAIDLHCNLYFEGADWSARLSWYEEQSKT